MVLLLVTNELICVLGGIETGNKAYLGKSGQTFHCCLSVMHKQEILLDFTDVPEELESDSSFPVDAKFLSELSLYYIQ